VPCLDNWTALRLVDLPAGGSVAAGFAAADVRAFGSGGFRGGWRAGGCGILGGVRAGASERGQSTGEP
jgi:hypothetical protein